MPAPSPARRAALTLLAGVLGDGRMLSDLTGSALAKLSPADRAAAQRLATGTLRSLGPIDSLLADHLSRRPPPPITRILQLATYELATGGAAHGIVNDAVLAAGALRKHRHLKGLVNAVLRKVAAEAPAKWPDLPAGRLPAWLRKPLVRQWGPRAMRAIETVQSTAPPIDLTAREDAAALAEATGGTLLPTGSVRLPAGTQVSGLPGYDAGAFWVQDAAAALPVAMLGDVRGLRVLDLCAAPGGKTLQLAARGALVTAVDISSKRMARVRDNLARTKLRAETRVTDAFEVTETFDAVLLDAPCTATGTLRRHPDLPHVKSGDSPEALAALQARMLDHALGLVAPGGTLVYATCSLLREEGEDQIKALRDRRPGVTVDSVLPAGAEAEWAAPEGGLRLRPDHWAGIGGIDGFYMAALRP